MISTQHEETWYNISVPEWGKCPANGGGNTTANHGWPSTSEHMDLCQADSGPAGLMQIPMRALFAHARTAQGPVMTVARHVSYLDDPVLEEAD
jgi:hypothetical protein